LLGQGQRRDTEGSALGSVFAIGLQHGVHLVLRGKKFERGSDMRILKNESPPWGRKRVARVERSFPCSPLFSPTTAVNVTKST